MKKYDGYHLNQRIEVILISNGTNQHYAPLRGCTEKETKRFTKESNHDETSDKPKSYKIIIHNIQRLRHSKQKRFSNCSRLNETKETCQFICGIYDLRFAFALKANIP